MSTELLGKKVGSVLEHDGYKLKILATRYVNDNTFAAELWTSGYEIEEPYAHVTINLPESAKEQELINPELFNRIKGSQPVAFIDVNGARWLENFLVENNLAYPVVGKGTCETNDDGVVVAHSGYCTYPLYAFRLENFDSIYDPLEED